MTPGSSPGPPDDSGEGPAKGRRRRAKLAGGRHGAGVQKRTRRVPRMGDRRRSRGESPRGTEGIRRGLAPLPLHPRTPYGTIGLPGAGRLLYPPGCERKLPCSC